MPLLSALNVRYLVGRGSPPPGADLVTASDDYWVGRNGRALPRAYVPRDARVVNGSAERLRLLGAVDFDPAAVAFVESDHDVAHGPFDASATIVRDEPECVEIDVDARTPSLVVLADHWYPGWVAMVDGREVRILRANHAVRAVEVPAGRSLVRYEYRPAAFRFGVILSVAAAGVLVFWPVAMCLGRAARARR